jgi:hypothetical protein
MLGAHGQVQTGGVPPTVTQVVLVDQTPKFVGARLPTRAQVTDSLGVARNLDTDCTRSSRSPVLRSVGPIV